MNITDLPPELLEMTYINYDDIHILNMNLKQLKLFVSKNKLSHKRIDIFGDKMNKYLRNNRNNIKQIVSCLIEYKKIYVKHITYYDNRYVNITEYIGTAFAHQGKVNMFKWWHTNFNNDTRNKYFCLRDIENMYSKKNKFDMLKWLNFKKYSINSHMCYNANNDILKYLLDNDMDVDGFLYGIFCIQNYNCINAIIDIKGYKYIYDYVNKLMAKRYKLIILTKIYHRSPMFFSVCDYPKN